MTKITKMKLDMSTGSPSKPSTPSVQNTPAAIGSSVIKTNSSRPSSR